MRDNWLDNELNEKFQDFDSEMNLEQEWAALQERRSTQQRQQPNKLWLLCAGIAVVSASWYLYSTPLTQNSSIETQLSKTVVEYKEVAQHNKATTDEVTKETFNLQIDNSQLQIEKSDNTSATSEQKNSVTRDLAPPSQSIQAMHRDTPNENAQQYTQTTVKQRTPNITQSTRSGNEIQISTDQSVINQITEVSQLLHTLNNHLTASTGILIELDPRRRSKANKAGAQSLSIGIGYSAFTSGTTFNDEKAIDGTSASLHYKKYLSPKSYLKTGLNIDKYTTRLEGVSTHSYTQVEDGQIIERYFNSDGTFDSVLGEAEVSIEETTEYHLYNRYQFVSIPVIFGLEVLERQRSYFAVEGGISASLISNYEIKEFDGVNTFNSMENLQLRKAGLLSGLAAISWHYQPLQSNKLDVFCRVGSRFQLNDLSDVGDYNVQRFNALNFGLGVQYRM